jgi:hypothetical protein
MDREALEKRLADLRRTLEQIQANGNATLGAIAECEYWLRKMQEKENGEANSLPEQKQ